MKHVPVKQLLVATVLAVASALPFASQAQDVTIGQTFLARGLDPAEGSNGWAKAIYSETLSDH